MNTVCVTSCRLFSSLFRRIPLPSVQRAGGGLSYWCLNLLKHKVSRFLKLAPFVLRWFPHQRGTEILLLSAGAAAAQTISKTDAFAQLAPLVVTLERSFKRIGRLRIAGTLSSVEP